MPSNEHQRRFRQLYGVGDEQPLRGVIVDESIPYEEDFSIYLLIHGQEGVSAVGFADLRRSFTFAFSTAEAAGRFVSAARVQGFMRHVKRILPMTIGEYFGRKRGGWTTADLCLDPDPGILSHPNVKLGTQSSN